MAKMHQGIVILLSFSKGKFQIDLTGKCAAWSSTNNGCDRPSIYPNKALCQRATCNSEKCSSCYTVPLFDPQNIDEEQHVIILIVMERDPMDR